MPAATPPTGLTEQELAYVQDTQFLLAKRRIATAIEGLLGQAEAGISQVLHNNPKAVPASALSVSGKLSRGENYQQLPYLMLDFPRKFQGGNIFAYRTMFWWGGFFSSTLHVQGHDLTHLRPTLVANLAKLRGQQVYIGCHDTPWQYTYTPDNYVLVDALPQAAVERLLQQHPFVKLSRQLPLAAYQQLPTFAVNTLELFLLCCQ